MSIYLSHLVPSKSLIQLVTTYKIGIESIHFSIADVLDQPDHGIADYTKELGDLLSHSPHGIHGPFFEISPAFYDRRLREVTKLRFEMAYEVAEKMEADYIIYHSGFLHELYYPEGWLSQSILFWQEFMQSRPRPIPIYIENVFEPSYGPLLKLMETLNDPRLGICLDVGHAHCYSHHPVSEWTKALAPYIKHFHFHNNHGTKDEHLGLCEGSIDFISLYKQFPELLSCSGITLELTDLTAVQTSLDYLKKLKRL